MTGRPREPDGIVNERTRIFIKRERVRRALIKTKPGETICLQYEDVAMLLKWLKELEETVNEQAERIKKYGIFKSK